MRYIWQILDGRSIYFFGVGIGLLIAWVTTGIAYLKMGNPVLLELTILELVVSVILFLVAFIINTKKGRWRNS